VSRRTLAKKLLRRGRDAAARAGAGVRGRLPGGARRREPAEVTFRPEGREATRREVPWGTTLLAAAREAGVDIDHFCGGCCSCGTCRVQILAGAGNLSRAQGNEEMVLGGVARDRGDRLACQARIEGPVEICIPEFYIGAGA